MVTNITHEHLDYHQTYEGYWVPRRLFDFLDQTVTKPHGNPRIGVLNRDDGLYAYLPGIPAEKDCV